MTEAMEGQTDSPSSYVDNQISESVEAPDNQETSTKSQEKMIPQSKVNEIVQARLAKDREVYTRKQRQVQEDNQENDLSEKNIDPSDLYISQAVGKELDKRLKAEHQRQNEAMLQQRAKEIEESLLNKIQQIDGKYEDFKDVAENSHLGNFPVLIAATDSVENSADVLYHLSKNPEKALFFAQNIEPIIDPATGRQYANPRAEIGMQALKKYADNLQNTEAAKNRPQPKEPLSQIRPSNVGTDNGRASITELRKKWTV